MDLSVVLLSYNTRDLIEEALRSVAEASTELEVEVFVVDNASHDGSADMVAERFPDVKLIRKEENVGFAAGNNVAFSQVTGRHVLLLNSDTVVRRDTLRTLVRFLDENPTSRRCWMQDPQSGRHLAAGLHARVSDADGRFLQGFRIVAPVSEQPAIRALQHDVPGPGSSATRWRCSPVPA